MKTAIYIRVSTDQQTFDSQLADLTNTCNQNGWSNPVIYEDKLSGAQQTRPGLHQLMTDVRSGKVTRILCFKLDRLGRSLSHLALIFDELMSHNVALIIPTQGIDTRSSNPAGKFQIGILMCVAEFERSIIRERVIAGQLAARKRGVHLGRKASHNITLPQVTTLKAQGLSLRAISRQLGVALSSIQNLLHKPTFQNIQMG